MNISLVATSHGTSVPEARAAITALVDAVRTEAPHLEVSEAFVDVQQPAVARALDTIAGPAVVVPLLLAPGFHVHVDIGQAVDRPTADAARTLGPDSRLTDLMVARLAQAGATMHDVLVLGAAGSTNRAAARSIDAAARMLGATWGSPIPVGYVGGPGTPIEEVVRDVSRAGRRVVVASYLMAPGYFHHQLTKCGADIVTHPLLDGSQVDPGMVSLVLDRYTEAAELLDGALFGREKWM